MCRNIPCAAELLVTRGLGFDAWFVKGTCMAEMLMSGSAGLLPSISCLTCGGVRSRGEARATAGDKPWKPAGAPRRGRTGSWTCTLAAPSTEFSQNWNCNPRRVARCIAKERPAAAACIRATPTSPAAADFFSTRAPPRRGQKLSSKKNCYILAPPASAAVDRAVRVT
jgi:hypothetical protein